LARDFYRCHHFITMLADDEPDQKLSKGWADKQNFCKFKACQALRLIQKGMAPPFGNPFERAKKEENVAKALQKYANLKDLPAKQSLKVLTQYKDPNT